MSDARGHFEAVLCDLSDLHGESRHSVREEVKKLLIKAGMIESSTTELSEEELDDVANKLHRAYHEDQQAPEGRMLPLDLVQILFSNQENYELLQKTARRKAANKKRAYTPPLKRR